MDSANVPERQDRDEGTRRLPRGSLAEARKIAVANLKDRDRMEQEFRTEAVLGDAWSLSGPGR